MRITLIAVGKLKAGPERDLAARYIDRLAKSGPPLGFEFRRVVELPESRASSSQARKADEADAILKAVPSDGALLALDERGETPDSERFADDLAAMRDGAKRDLAIVIGGADGLDDTVRQRADRVISFGRLTWPHQIVRILLAEQLYRAITILSGHPYHRS
ncbi:23S rRNA (pseudouridine(1915)-N(3))-methyltransferase RlmH [Pararhizobium haloflavum]|uniref:23S rRNA (pseudouridine(1915)-N(3))-methyltransferase RlmH n=1 Tax=Pararhizobium haloflavum TaxID=2037914 RepID=UPI000C17F8FD|nr:23S rRNA (pseudouridine(1915)-N(3))-methyltransferase RlmH [Pararhizobium haloflavum]